MTLTELRVRAILLYAQHPTGRGVMHMMPEDEEIAALAQEVLDLREGIRAMRELSIKMLRAANAAEYALQLERDSRRGPAAHLASLPPSELEVGPRLESSSKEGG